VNNVLFDILQFYKILINIEDLILELLTTIENRWNWGCLLSYLGEWWQSSVACTLYIKNLRAEGQHAYRM